MLNLRGCKKPHRLHFEMLNVFTEYVGDESEIKAIKDTFGAMDVDQGGSIEVDELREAYKTLH